MGSPFPAQPGVAWSGLLGERPTPQDFSYARGMRVPGGLGADALPSSYDLRGLGRVTSVKDQRPYGTCWAFAALGSLESCLLPGERGDFSEDNLVLQSGFDNWGVPYDRGGNVLMSTAYLVRWGGPMSEGKDAYADGYTPSMLSPLKHVQDVSWIPPRGSSLDNMAIKNAVMRFGAVDAALCWDGDTDGSFSPYYDAATASYYYDGEGVINHEVTVVGWDDDYAGSNFTTAPPGNGAFVCKNSWGPTWGDGGYFHVSYYDAAFGTRNPMAVFDDAEPSDNFTGIYQYDPLGDCEEVGLSLARETWFANVFTANETESLSAVGFYATAPNTSYKVYTGSSLATLTLRTSGTLDYMGYHTVRLPAPVSITSDHPFAVAVSIPSADGDRPIAIERPRAGYSSAASSTAGQSFVSDDGSRWTDHILWAPESNVCLKAYVSPFATPIIPSVAVVTPASGLAGTTVTLTGSGFTGTTAVAFGGAAADFSVVGDTQITATVPVGATTGAITVRTPTGSAYGATIFTVPGVSTIARLRPSTGRRGAAVVIIGAGFGAFRGVGSVKFGGSACRAYISWSDTRIKVRVPARAPLGRLKVRVTNAAGNSNARSFTVKN